MVPGLIWTRLNTADMRCWHELLRGVCPNMGPQTQWSMSHVKFMSHVIVSFIFLQTKHQLTKATDAWLMLSCSSSLFDIDGSPHLQPIPILLNTGFWHMCHLAHGHCHVGIIIANELLQACQLMVDPMDQSLGPMIMHEDMLVN